MGNPQEFPGVTLFSLGRTIAMTPTGARGNSLLPALAPSHIIDVVPSLNPLPGSPAGER